MTNAFTWTSGRGKTAQDAARTAPPKEANRLPRVRLLRRALGLEYFTVGWNIAEGLIAIAAALAAGSVALFAFGIDSFVESASGLVLVWRLAGEARGLPAARVEKVERRAQRLVCSAEIVRIGGEGRGRSCSSKARPSRRPRRWATSWLTLPRPSSRSCGAEAMRFSGRSTGAECC